MSVEHTIICDNCSAVGDASPESAAKARGALREQRHWKVDLPGGRDICEHCQEDLGVTR